MSEEANNTLLYSLPLVLIMFNVIVVYFFVCLLYNLSHAFLTLGTIKTEDGIISISPGIPLNGILGNGEYRYYMFKNVIEKSDTVFVLTGSYVTYNNTLCSTLFHSFLLNHSIYWRCRSLYLCPTIDSSNPFRLYLYVSICWF